MRDEPIAMTPDLPAIPAAAPSGGDRGLRGWNDAADASTAAVEHLEQVWSAEPLAELDPEEFYDFQVNRPTVNWTTRADAADRMADHPLRGRAAARRRRDVVLIRGIEPSTRWRVLPGGAGAGPARSVEIVLLGALLADVPYTRPLPVAGRLDAGWPRSSTCAVPLRGPDRHRRRAARTPAPAPAGRGLVLGHVPHYANNPPCPKATLALLHRVEEVLDMSPCRLVSSPQEARDVAARRRRAGLPKTRRWHDYVRPARGAARTRLTCRRLPARRSPVEFERYLRRRGDYES